MVEELLRISASVIVASAEEEHLPCSGPCHPGNFKTIVGGHKVSYTSSPMSENDSLVIGASGNVGGFIVDHLFARGDRVFALSRSHHQSNERVTWFTGELTSPEELHLPVFSTELKRLLGCRNKRPRQGGQAGSSIGPAPLCQNADRDPTSQFERENR